MRNLSRSATLVVLLVLGAMGSSFARPFDNNTWPIVITPSVSSAASGSPVSFGIGMNQSGSSATTVYLTSDHPGILAVPSTVTVPTGSSSAYVAPSDATLDEPPATPTYVTITATANGHSTQTQVLVY